MQSGENLSKHCLFGLGVRDKAFPDRIAMQCIQEIIERVHATQGHSLHHLGALSLSKPLKKPLREIMRRYQDAGMDKTAEVQGKVDELKDNMHDNVRKILETHQSLESLEQRTDNMNQQANQFLKQSVDLRRAIQWRNYKLKFICFLIGTALLTYFVWLIAGKPTYD